MRDPRGPFPRYREGALAVAPFAPAIAGAGILFGCLARSAGFSWSAAVIMSATTFAGSAQFAAVATLAAGGTALAASAAAALLNLRYAVMGAAMAPAIRGRAWRRALIAQLVVDETFAAAADGPHGFREERLIGAGALLFLVHTGATVVGALAVPRLFDLSAWGLDGAVVALFVVVLRSRLVSRAAWLAALAGGAVTLLLTPALPPGLPLLAAGGVAVVGHARR